MSIFRPSNINKRLVGVQDQSPGNGGVIGPDKNPYCLSGVCPAITLGCRYFCGGGSCPGRFNLKESFCGAKERCYQPTVDCFGRFICCGPGTCKWFAADISAEVTRIWGASADANTVATACFGSQGWFVPSIGQYQATIIPCVSYFCPREGKPFASFYSYWASDGNTGGGNATFVGFYGGPGGSPAFPSVNQTRGYYVRSLRSTAT